MREEELSIRRFEPRDADRLWTIHEKALRNSGIEFIEDKADEDFRKIPERYLETDGEFLVGSVDGEIVAMGGFRPISGRCAEIRRMRVHPTHQGRGYGKRMLTELESCADDRGYSELRLYTNAKLEAARGLYSSEGYVFTGREIDEDADEAFIHYRKDLDGESVDTSDG